jgi:hypothetical protein
MAAASLTRRIYLDEQRVSVTSLLAPAHQLRLLDRHWNELEVDPLDLIPSLLGTAWHDAAAQHDPPEGVSEERLEVEFQGWRISGQPDYWDSEVVIDRKTAKTWSRIYGSPEWEQQLNLYAWLIDQIGPDAAPWPRRLEIHVVYTDWMESGAKRNADYPKSRFEIIPIPNWSADETASFIRQRLDLLEMPTPPLCSSDERWTRAESWAVMRQGRKTAVRLCVTEHEAEMLAEEVGGYVEYRPGNPVRCRTWCAAQPFCEFGKNL